MKNKLYDVIKYTTLIAIPALTTAYVGMDAALNDALPYENEVAKGAVVITTLLGALVGIQSNRYNKSEDRYDGSIEVNSNDPAILHGLDLDKTDPVDLLTKDKLVLKIETNDAQLPPPTFDS